MKKSLRVVMMFLATVLILALGTQGTVEAVSGDDVVYCAIKSSLFWNTFMGAGGGHRAENVIQDNSGNVFVLGTSSIGWGTSPVRPFSYNYDAFVAKLDGDGNRLWHTFLGGFDMDIADGFVMDGSGNMYILGTSLGTWGSPLHGHQGELDMFVAKIDSSGVLQWHTFLGSSVHDRAYGIAWDGANLYVLGESHATWGSPAQPFSGGIDLVLAKLTAAGALTWNTFVCASEIDQGKGAITADGTSVYVTSASTASWGTPARPFSGGAQDAFVAKFNDTGGLLWSTFLGSTGTDQATGIAVDSGGNVYVCGDSNRSWGTPVRPFASGNYDAFVAKLNSLAALTWNTFLGSAKEDTAGGLALDGAANVYVAGTSTATWGTPFRAFSGGTGNRDVFAARLNGTGKVQWNGFLGAAHSSDYGPSISVDAEDNVAVGGESNATWGTPVNPHSGEGGSNAFAALIAQPSITVTEPSAGESLIWSFYYNITWTAKGAMDANVSIDFMKSGVRVRSISSSAPNNGLFSLYQIPSDLPPGNYQVRIRTLDNKVQGTSGQFKVVKGTIEVFSPGGGATWARGTTETISWVTNGCPGTIVNIQLLKSNGVLVKNLATAYPNSCYIITDFNWSIPLTLAPGTYKVRVKTAGGTVKDDSGLFTIN